MQACRNNARGSSCTSSSTSTKPGRRRRRRQAASPLATALLVLSCAHLAAAQGLSFIWYFDQQNDASIPQCSTLDISIGPLDNITHQPEPPYYLISYPTGATPSTFDASEADGGVFSWSLGYPSGTQFMLGMVDSKGNSGGIVRVYTVGDGTTTCPSYQTANSAFSFSINPTTQPRTCQNVDFTVQGGVAPYTVTTAISMDTGINQTFPNSSISVQNVLSGGATYILALSDSTGAYAASPDLIYSGGGGDTSCLVTTPTTSNRPTKTSTSDGSSSSKNPAIIGSVVGICAVLLIGAAVAFLMYRRRKKAQHQSFLAGRLSGTTSGDGGGGSGGGSPYGGSANGREKFFSPVGAGGAVHGGGGMWRPESPTEYPGITSAPVRFRVTNPDDDARSERSFRMGGGRSTASSARPSEDTVRTHATKPWSSGNEGPYRNDRSQRRSLIESDANALYPPTSYNHTLAPANSPTSRFGQSLPSTGGSTGSTGSFEDADQPWPTYSSVASSETEDHYTDLPASSAGILSHNRSRIDSVSRNMTRGGAGGVGGRSDEMDVEEMYRNEVYSRDLHSEELSIDPSWESLTRPGMTTSPSNAYGSPFADSQRVTS